MSRPPKLAKPSKSIFDPFNSSATGHQRADNRLSGSTSWRDSRSAKLQQQFKSGSGGGKRVSDSVGAGSLNFGHDGRTESGGWEKGAKGLRTGGQKSIWESMDGIKVQKENADRPNKKRKLEEADTQPTKVVNPYTPFRREDGKIRETSWPSHESSPSHLLSPYYSQNSQSRSQSQSQSQSQSKEHPHTSTQAEPEHIKEDNEEAEEEKLEQAPPQIFANLCIYINGSTAPTISDHKLKYLLHTHGARTSIGLGRRTVTHVIIGRPGSNGGGGGGGGLSGTKLQKEVARTGGKAVRYVTAEWVVESVEAGRRLPESRFEGLRLAPKGVESVASILGGVASKSPWIKGCDEG